MVLQRQVCASDTLQPMEAASWEFSSYLQGIEGGVSHGSGCGMVLQQQVFYLRHGVGPKGVCTPVTA
jgi:hypothetical protein